MDKRDKIDKGIYAVEILESASVRKIRISVNRKSQLQRQTADYSLLKTKN